MTYKVEVQRRSAGNDNKWKKLFYSLTTNTKAGNCCYVVFCVLSPFLQGKLALCF